MRRKIAACVHVYYEDMWDFLVPYLYNLPEDTDLYITCRDDILPQMRECVARDLGGTAEVVVMPNLGMDVLPFLSLCLAKELYRYDAVLKLHTKNQKSKLRADQGRIMLDGLCGSKALVEQIVDVFRRDLDAGMIGSAFQLRSASALMYRNRGRMSEILDLLDIQLDDWPLFTGTMFWIAGPLLKDISALAPMLVEQAIGEKVSRTGDDGTLAHALERVFGALAKASAANVYLTERRNSDSADYLVLNARFHAPANSRRLLELESHELVRRHIAAPLWCKIIRESDLFDTTYYKEASNEFIVPGMDPVYHFVLYGDIFEINPSQNFNTTFYQLYRPDVVRKQICSLAHYLRTGWQEGMVAEPTDDDWFLLAKRLKLFNPKWYTKKYPDVGKSRIDVDTHYKLIGQFLGRAVNANFDPETIPVLQRDRSDDGQSVLQFLKRHYLSEMHLYSAMKRAGRYGDVVAVHWFAKRILNQYGPGRALNEALATNYTLRRQWTRANGVWTEFWNEIKTGQNSGRHFSSVMAFDRPSKPLSDFTTINLAEISVNKDERKSVTALKRGRICVYTTLFGNIDNLIPILSPTNGVDFICFTDRIRDAKGWRQVIVTPGQSSDNLNAKIYKILPHRYLADYEYSLFVDANTVFLGRINEMIDICSHGGDFVMWQHPVRDDIYTEVCAIIAHRRHSPVKVLEQLKHYADDGMPENTGMFEASFIWRRHGDPDVAAFMESWWAQICKFSSRDQISLAYLVWKSGTRPTLLPRELGTSRENIYFFKARHRHGATRNAAEQNPLLVSPALRNKPREITFLYHKDFAGSGSTVLRGQQLSQAVAGHYHGRREVRYTSESTDIRDAVVVLSKGFLKMTTPEELHDLRRSNILIADFVDEPPNKDLIGEIDMLMASSLCGYKDYLRSFPNVPSCHVTHHVDIRIPVREIGHADQFRAGYFGELVNTIRHRDIENLVEFNLVDTSRQTTDWIGALSRYNFHYAFRRTRAIDGAKPFLKGFVAAHCGANMMIQKSAGDASFYLGADYPYLMEDDASPADIVEALQCARDTMGGPKWHYASEIMREVRARSSLDYVLREFDDMLNAL